MVYERKQSVGSGGRRDGTRADWCERVDWPIDWFTEGWIRQS